MNFLSSLARQCEEQCTTPQQLEEAVHVWQRRRHYPNQCHVDNAARTQPCITKAADGMCGEFCLRVIVVTGISTYGGNECT